MDCDAAEPSATHRSTVAAAGDLARYDLDGDGRINAIEAKAMARDNYFYKKGFAAAVLLLALLGAAIFALSLAASELSKEMHVTQATLTNTAGGVMHTAFATTAVPLYTIIAMTSAQLIRVRHLSVSFFSEEHDNKTIEVTLDIVERVKVDKVTVELKACDGQKVVVRGDEAELHLPNLPDESKRIRICGGDAGCSSLMVRRASSPALPN